MNWKNKLTEILKIKFPIILGPFGGGYSSIALASTVSNAGGMGSFGAHNLSHDEIIDLNNDLKKATKETYALNLWIDNSLYGNDYSDEDFERTKTLFKPYFDELGIDLPSKPVLPEGHSNEKQLAAIVEARPPVFSFVYGIPDDTVIQELKKGGTKLIGTATTVEEAIMLEDAGVDVVVATGFEAGGHRVAFLEDNEAKLMGSISLIPRVADVVDIPVVAAGGIADGRGIISAFSLGALGVQIGTAFLACDESNATDLHKKVLNSSVAENTMLTPSFTGRKARGTVSKIAEETRLRSTELAPYPLQGLFLKPLRKAALAQGRTDMISFWSGQSAPLIKYSKATELFENLITESEQVLHELSPQFLSNRKDVRYSL